MIQMLYDEHDNGYYIPMYVELIVLLFYHGFATTKEIVAMKRDMVDFDNLIVNLPGKQKANELVLSVRSPEDTEMITK